VEQPTASRSQDTRQAAVRYLRNGLAVIPIPPGEKNPNRRGWQNERHTVEDVPRLWDDGQGVGVLWGEPSGGMVDVDLDWPEARIAAAHILPPTRTFGRASAPESHRVYRITGTIPKTKRYKIPGEGDDNSVVEILATGTQALVPPSLHESGEARQWYQDRPSYEVDGEELLEGIADVATAALLARHWPGKGARHDFVLAASGFVGRRLPKDRAEKIMHAATAASGDEELFSRMNDVTDTLEALVAGRATTGGTTLANLAPGLVDQLQRWHGWGSNNRHSERTHQTDHDEPSFNLTDLGNSERLLRRHGRVFRCCYEWNKKYLVYDGTRWQIDATAAVERMAKATVRSIYGEAATEPDDDKRKALVAHAKRSEQHPRVEAMIRLARSEVAVDHDQLDADPWLLNAKNGTVDLRTGELRPHRREDMLTKRTSVAFDPEATAPLFDSFLERILPDPALRSFLQRAMGYAACGVVSEEILVVMHGTGDNGKTTLINAVKKALGDYAMEAAPELLMAKKGSHPTELADLFRQRFVACVETEQDRRLAEARAKALTGREQISARRMREDFWRFWPTHTIILATNHRPEIRGTDHAIWRRVKLTPFEVAVPKAEQDPRLEHKLTLESAGILNWLVHGCLAWQSEGLGEPEAVKAATGEYREEQDILAGFFAERCVVREGLSVLATQLYSEYEDWAAEQNEKPLTSTKFGRRVKERGFRSNRPPENNKKTTYHGLALASRGN
jgi:P4 family phage/plasmid primase-like protien